MQALLNDQSNFEPLTNDPTTRCTNEIKKRLESLQSRNFIDKRKKLLLVPTAPIPPRVYGLYKIHKPNHPLRLITSTIQSPSYDVAKELTFVLTRSFSSSKFAKKNSREVLDTIRSHRLLRDQRLVSFDMVNCFGSIPTTLAIDLVAKQFDQNIAPHTNWPKDDFISLLKYCLDECNYLLFEGAYYRQKNGIFMGNSLGSILVQIVTDHIIDDIQSKLKVKRLPSPAIWCVYVDDHLLICRHDLIDTILELLNSFDPHIQFTKELEVNNSLNYLDLTVTRQNGSITTNWFSKAIASNRILNFHSAHPKQMIHNVARSFTRKLFEYSDRQFYDENVHKINSILTKNGFPPNVISQIIHSVTNESPQRSNNNDREKTCTHFCSLSYIPGVTESLSRQINYFTPHVTVARRPDLKNNRFFSKQKQKLPKDMTSNCVYRIDCLDCENIYVGETTKLIKSRIYQHNNSVAPQNIIQPKTALAAHANDTQHQFDFKNIKILDRKNNLAKLKTSEINHIIMNQNVTCNFKSDSSNISKSFGNILRSHIGIPAPVHTAHTHTQPT